MMDDYVIFLRAERYDKGIDRVYSITSEAADASGVDSLDGN